MFIKNVFNFFLLFLLVCSVFPSLTNGEENSEEFCYLDSICDPDSDKWPGECKTGKHQSPINLVSISPNTKPETVDLTFSNGYSFPNFWIKNNGHTIQVNVQNSDRASADRASMYGYELDRPYIFEQIHFHWGEDDSMGSEHTLNDKHFAMEVHLVHYDSQYESFAAASISNDSKALAVLGVFLTAGDDDLDTNSAFDVISSNLPLLYQPTQSLVNLSLDLSSLLPKTGAKFYRYLGSLTTPNCTEAVEWTVLEESLRVKPSEIQRFRLVQSHENKPLGRNFRPIQNLTDRKLEYLAKGKGTSLNTQFGLFTLVLLLVSYFLIF